MALSPYNSYNPMSQYNAYSGGWLPSPNAFLSPYTPNYAQSLYMGVPQQLFAPNLPPQGFQTLKERTAGVDAFARTDKPEKPPVTETIVRQAPKLAYTRQQPDPLPDALFSRPQAVPYSQAIHMAHNGKVREVRIRRDLHSITALPQAVFVTDDNKAMQATLPKSLSEYTRVLEDNNVPYSFEAKQHTTLGKAKDLATETFRETLIPILVFGITAALGWVVWKYIFKRPMEEAPVRDALIRSSQSPNNFSQVKGSMEDILAFYDDNTQSKAKDFRAGRKDVLIAQGPPGTGKTYMLEALALEALKKPDVLCFDPAKAPAFRQLLGQMYSGDEIESKRAVSILETMNGGKPVKELLLFVNEAERFIELETVINDALGNPSMKTRVPKLRILGTSNSLPPFNGPAKSRISDGIMIVDYPSVDKRVSIVGRMLQEGIGANYNAADLSNQRHLRTVLEDNPSYSIRSTRKVVDDVVAKAKAENLNADATLKALDKRFEQQPMDDGEIAALIRHAAVQFITDPSRTLNPASEKGVELFNRRTMLSIENKTKGLDVELNMNSKALYPLIEEQLAEVVAKQPNHEFPLDRSEAIKTLSSVANALGALALRRIPKAEETATTQMIDRVAHGIEALEGYADHEALNNLVNVLEAKPINRDVWHAFHAAYKLTDAAKIESTLLKPDTLKQVLEAVLGIDDKKIDDLDASLRPISESLQIAIQKASMVEPPAKPHEHDHDHHHH